MARNKMRNATMAVVVLWVLLLLGSINSCVQAGLVVHSDETDTVSLDHLVMTEEEELMTTEGRELQAEDPAFNIALTFATTMTSAQRSGFTSAQARWQSIITKDYDTRVCLPAGFKICGFTFQKRTCIDDLLIIARVKPIDGKGNILGQAGPCATVGYKVRIGVMTFDDADADMLIAEGSWKNTILHEMGHILGIGTMWDARSLITGESAGPPYYYLGDNGNAGLQDVVGVGRVVIEDTGGPGTSRGHWKEAVYDTELMTGWIEKQGIPMPLSEITLRSLADLGYTVDVTKADPYTVPSSGRRLRGTEDKRPVGNDLFITDLVELTQVYPKPGRIKKPLHKDA